MQKLSKIFHSSSCSDIYVTGSCLLELILMNYKIKFSHAMLLIAQWEVEFISQAVHLMAAVQFLA